MKRLLIVSDPPAAPGYLPRVRFLCEYLVRKGFDVTLLTEEYQPLAFEHTYPVITIPMYSGSKLDWLLKTIWTLLTDWHNRAFARKAINYQLSKFDLSNNRAPKGLRTINYPFDYVICSAFSDFPLGAGLRIAKALNVPLICDIRDLDEQVDNSKYQYKHQSRWLMPFRRIYRAIHIKRRNKVLRAANAITTVSPWHADFIRQFNPNVQVVYNGYDPKQFYPENIPTDQFTITYIGSLFEWQKPALEKVKQAIEELNESSIINHQLSIDIHTPKENPISHDCLGDAIRHSSIMMVLTSPDTHGMLTTKFYEALGCEKPILCVPSDHGSLAELIEYTHAGIATDDKEEIEAFIIEKYEEWKKQSFTHQPTIHRDDFSRENQYDQFYSTYIQR